MATLIAIFVPGFDRYKQRQGGIESAQQITQAIQQTRTYALAPGAVNFTNSNSSKNQIAFYLDIKNSQYSILRMSPALDSSELLDNSSYIQSAQTINSKWHILCDSSLDTNYCSNTSGLVFAFQYSSASLSVYDNFQNKAVIGYDVAKDTTRIGGSNLSFYITPKNISGLSNCTSTDLGCTKVNINLISGAVSYVAYKQ